MPDSPHDPLPKGANGLDLGALVLAFARDKLVFTPKGLPEHYTLHLGPNSKVIDIHKTTLRPDGTIEYLTLFSMTHERLLAMMDELAQPLGKLLMGLARPLSPAWMEKRRVGAIVGLVPTGNNIASIGQLRRRKFAIDPRRLAAHAWAPDFIDELYDIDGKIFTLVLNQRNRTPRKIGYGFSVADARGKRRLVWIPDRSVAHAMERGSALLKNAAAKYGAFAGDADRCA